MAPNMKVYRQHDQGVYRRRVYSIL